MFNHFPDTSQRASGQHVASGPRSRTLRSVLTGTALLALVVAPLAGSAVAQSSGTAAVAASGTSYNPLANYSEWNVISFGDAFIKAESEGPVAVGGTLTFTGTNVAMHNTANVDGQNVGLIAKNLNFSGSTDELKGLFVIRRGLVRLALAGGGRFLVCRVV